MKRIDFIKQTIFTSASITLLASGKPLPGKKHAATPGETEGPFPTHAPATLAVQNIIADRTGTPLTITISVNNINNKCAGLKDVIVDIWHCDNKGEYSEYGGKDEHGNHGGPGGMLPGGHRPPKGSFHKGKNMPPPGGGGSMQATDYTNVHFLRGRQVTNANGQVSFHSIYPGWYPGRAPHVHVHIYDAGGKSLLVTQIAFPENISKHVYDKGVYAAHGLPDTNNATDNVFNDSIANELGSITGNTADGFVLSHSIYVKA
jgi:protocatechuate 3,4-dioxygenase beta subunit